MINLQVMQALLESLAATVDNLLIQDLKQSCLEAKYFAGILLLALPC